MKKNKTPKTSTTGYPAKKHFPILVAAKNEATRRERIEKISSAFRDFGNEKYLKPLEQFPYALLIPIWVALNLFHYDINTRRYRGFISNFPVSKDPIRWGNVSKFSL